MDSLQQFGDKRSMRGKLRFIIGGLVVLVIAASLISYGLWQQSNYEWQAKDKAAENARHTNQDIQMRCVPLPALDERNCAIEAAREQRGYERQEQDLYAQKTTAIWTFLMGSAAIIGMMLSSVGIWLVYSTFGETRRTANAAILSANHAALASGEMQEANRISERATNAQLRAYLSVRPLVIDHAGHGTGRAKGFLQIVNNGETPAVVTKLAFRITWVIKGESIELMKYDAEIMFKVHKGTPVTFPVEFSTQDERFDQQGHVFGVGRIEYSDVFHAAQKEKFAFRTGEFVPFYDLDFPVHTNAYPIESVLDVLGRQGKLKKKTGKKK
jgi:hypothetical protein